MSPDGRPAPARHQPAEQIEASDDYDLVYRRCKQEERLHEAFLLVDHEGFIRAAFDNAEAWLRDARTVAEARGNHGHDTGATQGAAHKPSH